MKNILPWKFRDIIYHGNVAGDDSLCQIVALVVAQRPALLKCQAVAAFPLSGSQNTGAKLAIAVESGRERTVKKTVFSTFVKYLCEKKYLSGEKFLSTVFPLSSSMR